MTTTNTTGNPMQLFKFDNVATGDTFALSALEKDGQAWFVAGDVCKALGIRNVSDALSRLDDDEKGVGNTDTLGGIQQVGIINESGLYSLIFRSHKEGAKRFKKWVTSQVIPSIRQHGGYINGEEALPKEEQAQTLQVIQDEAQRLRARHVEDRDARSDTFRLLSSGRKRRKSPRPAKPSAAPPQRITNQEPLEAIERGHKMHVFGTSRGLHCYRGTSPERMEQIGT